MSVNFYHMIWHHYPEDDIPHYNTYLILTVLEECSFKGWIYLLLISHLSHSWSLKVSSILDDLVHLSELSEYYKELLPTPGQQYRYAAYAD
jgi:hypothetical protein